MDLSRGGSLAGVVLIPLHKNGGLYIHSEDALPRMGG